MKVHVTVDARAFNRQLTAYTKATRIERKAGLIKQARLLLRDLIKATPPFDNRLSKGTFTQSFNAQRKAGKDAVASDIRSLFATALPDISKLPIKSQKRARGYAKRGDWDKLFTLFHRLSGGKGSVNAPTVHGHATQSLHQSRRNSKGRVVRGSRIYVANRPSINKLIKARQSDVGKWKSGWMRAAKGLNIRGIPKWISGKSGSGDLVDLSSRFYKPSITIINNVRGSTGRNIDIAKAAMANRVRSMRIEVEKREEAARRKAMRR